MIRVLIADDSAFMRKVLSDLFKSQSDFEVVGTAVNGQDTIEKVKRQFTKWAPVFASLVSHNGLACRNIYMKKLAAPKYREPSVF